MWKRRPQSHARWGSIFDKKINQKVNLTELINEFLVWELFFVCLYFPIFFTIITELHLSKCTVALIEILLYSERVKTGLF